MKKNNNYVAINEEYKWLNNAELQINPKIQRKLSTDTVEQITKNFSPLVANPIKVSYRNKKYYIFDGMHTRSSLCALNGTDDFPIYCRVYHGLTEEDEAKLFATQFGYTQPVPMSYRLRALAVAKDPDVLNFLKATKDAGFKMSFGTNKTENGRIAAVCEAYMSYHKLGATSYTRMLKILHKTWAGESWSITRNMIAGMTRLMLMYKIDSRLFVRTFREVTYREIKKEVDRFPGMSKDGAYAAALAEIYERRVTSALEEVRD